MATLSQAHGSSSQPKPPRLRSACNQCNAAKVKCSGERHGCTRCKSLRVQCIYTESRVGKVQGSRARAKKLEAQQMATTPEASSPRTASYSTGLEASAVASPSSHAPDSLAQNMALWPDSTWPEDFLMLDSTLATMDSFLEPSTVSPSVAPSGSSAESGDSLGDGLLMTPKSCPPEPCPPPSTAKTQVEANIRRDSQQDPESRQLSQNHVSTETDSKCVLACAHMLATLENYILSKLSALDLILDTVRKAADELKKLVQLQQQSRSDRCIALFTAIMFQMTELLERGAKPASDEGPLPSLQTNFMPAFGLGSFSVSVEEQNSWRSRIVRREIAHVGEILASVLVLARLGPRGASVAPEAVVQRTGCLVDLERKLQALGDGDS